MYIEKADERLQKHATKNPAFIKYYETCKDFRELCNLLTTAPNEKIKECIDLLQNGKGV